MKKKCLFKLLAFAVVWAMVFSCACPASAAVSFGDTYTTEMPVTDQYPRGLFAYMVTTAYNVSDRQPIGLRAEHKPGATTSLGVSVGESATSTASASFGFSTTSSVGIELGVELCLQVNATYSSTLSAEAGVSYSVTKTMESSVEYELGENVDPGIYSCYLVFPRKTVTCGLYTYDSDGTKEIIGTQHVTYAPRVEDMYITWDIYELGS